ncbi:MAG TPA: cohesin domain-containing protein [Terracidiphilus sp.]|nr:cohesin domain-containing protein [Terracidiphilus sp.]
MNRRAQAPAAPGLALSRTAFRIALIAVLALTGLASARLHAQSAGSLFKSGQSAEAREDYDAAFDFFQKANAKNPKDLSYRTALYRLRVSASAMHLTRGRKFLQSGDEQSALAEFLHASAIDPGNEAAQQEISRIRQGNGQVAPASETAMPEPAGEQQSINSMSAPVDLRPLSNEPLTLHMTEDAKVVYQAIGKAAGVNVLFDPDYNSKRIQVDLNNVSLMDALRIVGTMSGTFWRPVTANTLFVAQNTRIKRTELDEQAVQTFYLSNAWQQNDLNDVQTALRNVLTSAKIYGVASQNAIVMRGTPDELLLAQKLINDLDKARAEVVVDIAVLEVSKNWERTLGISWPSSFGVSLQPSTGSSNSTCPAGSTTCTPTTGVSPTLYDLAHLKATDFAVTVGSATLNLLLTDANTKVMQSPRIRATDDQKATMKIGSRIPIATGSYQTGAATAVVSSLVNTQFQYQDVGVNIEMTPTVHFDRDITLKIKIEVTSQSGSVTISGVTEPILSQRVVDQVIRLREGEASILGGIQNNQEQQNWNGIPGLSYIPVLKYLFGSKDNTVQNDEIVFVVLPHVVRSQVLDQANLRAIDTGSGQSIDLRHTSQDGSDTNPAPAAAPVVVNPTALEHSPLGTAPGSTAEAAAPALMAQLSAAAQNTGNPAAPTPPPAPASTPALAPTPTPAAGASFTLTPPTGPIAAGASFQIPVVLSGGADIASVPIQLQYDPAKISLVNVAAGDLLNRDGQAVALIHRDDGPGNITVVAARPPGAAGISGTGVVCVLTFQAKAAGDTALTMTRAGAVNSAQQQVPAQAAHVNLTVK